MIETLCSCGKAINAVESAVGRSTLCKSCGKSVRLVAGEQITPDTALGDFDARFIIIAGPTGLGDTIAIGGLADLDMGKAPERAILLDGVKVSRKHARLVRLDFGPSRWKLIDDGSRNGVAVNGQKITEIELNSGDLVRIGDYQLRYVVGFPKQAPAVTKKQTIKCSGCGTEYSNKTVVCISCGINLQTGKALVTSRGLDENAIAIRANTVVRIISWILWTGLVPIASEAFGTYKARAIWVITAITVLVSLIFFIPFYSNGGIIPPPWSHYELWVGSPDAAAAQRAQATRDFDKSMSNREDKNGGHLTDRQIDEIARFQAQMDAINANAADNNFHFYQLFTNILLHAGIMHLVGNLVFLIVFGLRVNELIGDLKMAIVYPLLGILASGVFAISAIHGPFMPALGASGAIMGLAGMYIVFFPVHRVYMLIWFRGGIFTGWRVLYKIFRMQGFWLLVLWVGLNDVLPTVRQQINGGVSHDSTAHWAHLGGFTCGVIIAIGLLVTKQVNAHRADLLSLTLGKNILGNVEKPLALPA